MRLCHITLILLLAFIFIGCDQDDDPDDTTNMYKNPVIEPVIADPSIIRADDGYFYVYATEDFFTYETGVRFVAIFRSKDLVNWEDMGDAFESKPTWKSGNPYIWAPDIQFFNGKYHLYYSLSVWHDPNPAIGVATSDTPYGPFVDQGKVFDSNEIGVPNSIDPFVYITEDNEKWMFWGSWHGIWAIKLSNDGLSYVGDKIQVAGNAFEASYVIKREGYYYLFASIGHCCAGDQSTYQTRVGRSTSLLGPYYDRQNRNLLHYNGSLVVGDGDRFIGNGHNAIAIDDAGEHWLIYHGIDRLNPRLPNGATRRPLMIDRIIWDAADWPQLRNFRPTETYTEAPYIKED